MKVVSPTSVIRNALNSRADLALSALETRTCHSWKMGLDRAQVQPRTPEGLDLPSLQLFIREGLGAHITDLDGNHFIDLSMGFGTLLLGHRFHTVQDAIATQAARGWYVGLTCERQLDLARYIQAAGPANERVAFYSCGSSAAAYALEAARISTGREAVGVFASTLDDVLDPALSPDASDPVPRTGATDISAFFTLPWHRRPSCEANAPEAATDSTVILAYGQTSAFDYIRRLRGDLAAVIVEPVSAADPSFDHAAWLQELAHVCKAAGVLLILDERLTGFRLAYGGAQERFGLTPDLVAYGEVLGGGMPLGAVAGRADILDNLAVHEAELRGIGNQDFSGNALSIAAGAATLEHLSAHRAALYPDLEKKAETLAAEVNAFAVRNEIPVVMRSAASMFRLCFTFDADHVSHAVAGTAFLALVLSRGVLMHASRLGFLSSAHTDDDMTRISSALCEALCDVKSDGLFGQCT